MLAGQVAIVTGAGRGLGRGIADGLRGAGARVACLDRDGSLLDLGRSEGGAESLWLAADVTSEHEIGESVEAVLSHWGRVDILVNNAGYAPSESLAEIDVERWREILDINLTGAFICSRAVLASMRERGSGRIINIGSQLGFVGSAALPHYAAAKAGLHGLTKSLARALAGDGILVNAVAPGPVDTEGLAYASPEVLTNVREEVPLRRFAQVEEIVPTVLLLASPAGGFYTGSILNVSGGHVM